jgi:hypothetical protein
MTSKRLSSTKVRLSDSALLAGGLSLLYAAAIMLWPRAFPQLLLRVFYGGHFFRTLAFALVAANGILFFFISRRRSERGNPLTFGYIAVVTVTATAAFRTMVMIAHDQAVIAQFRAHITVPQGIDASELLAYAHLGIVSGIILPYLLCA